MFDSPNERTTLLAKNSSKDLEESDVEETNRNNQHSNSSSNSNANGDTHSDSDVEDSTEEVHTFRWSRLKFYLIEPMVLILLFAYNLSSTILKNQIIYQTCTAVFLYNDTDCKLLSTKNASEHTKQIETIVQPYAARIFMTTTIIECIVPALCGSFIGSWSDRFGRKPLLVTAFTGYTLYYAVIAIVCYISTMSLLSPWYYLLAVLPHSILGGSVTYNVAAICFISDVSTAEERPYRMTIYEVAIYIGLMLGSFTAGFLYEATNSTIVFTVSASSIAFATLILLIFIPESLNLRQAQPVVDGTENNTAHEPNTNKLFELSHFKDMWTTCFKERPFNNLGIIWLTISCLQITVFVVGGSTTVFYLFIREQFHWTVKEFTMYETISILVPILGNLLGIWFLRKCLQLSVITIGILAFLSQVGSSFMKAFALSNLQIYLSIGFGALKSMANPMCRTILASVVPAEELGKIFALNSVLQSLVPFVASPIYTIIYSITLATFPGFFNLISAFMFILAIAFLLLILRKQQSFPAQYETIST